MSLLTDVTGAWSGSYRLILPDTPDEVSDTAAMVTAIAGGRFMQIDYTWAYQGEPQAGSLWLGTADSAAAQGAWVDAWHMGDTVMALAGADGGDAVRFDGSYDVPDSPPWGWRVELSAGDDGFVLRMFNVSPEGEPYLGVEALYHH
jgi:hypothetical protein